jgi:hypothetical protein
VLRSDHAIARINLAAMAKFSDGRFGLLRLVAGALGPDYAHVTSFKARPAFGSFTVVRNANKDLWT